MEVFIDFTEIPMKAVLCEEDNQQYSRGISMLQESGKAYVIVGNLCAGSYTSCGQLELLYNFHSIIELIFQIQVAFPR